MIAALVSILLLLVVFGAIITRRLDPTLVAGLCAVGAMAGGLVSQDVAFASIDWNTIFLLIALMMFVGMASETGLFQYLAIVVARLALGRPELLVVFLVIVTGVLSALLGKVATVLLIAPVTLLIADSLEVKPNFMLLAIALAANLGGFGTLIGAPSNIMVGSVTGFGFLTFASFLGPQAVFLLLVCALFFRFWTGRRMRVDPELAAAVTRLDPRRALTDPSMTRKFMVVFSVIMAAFLFHEAAGIRPATVALAGAFLLALMGKVPLDRVFQKVDWTTVFFFIGLFIVISAMSEQGVFSFFSARLVGLSGDRPVAAALGVMWFTAMASAFAGAVPVTAAMIPVTTGMAAGFGANPDALWWALAIGAALGTNGTVTGSASNVIICSIAQKHSSAISYARFFRYGFLFTLVSLCFATAYLYLGFF